MHFTEEELDKQITIDGNFISNYNSIVIHQFLYQHHTFEIVLDIETIEEVGTYTLDRSKEWLGKQLTTNVSGKGFIGIILDISMKHDEVGLHGKLVLKGLSQSILLENGKQQKSWLEKDLASVVTEIVSTTDIKNSIQPVFTGTIAYQCQYNESNYSYLQRLAHQHNEWFYFNGVSLVFGKPASNDEAPIELQYSRDIENIQIKIKTYIPSLGTSNYNALTDENHQGEHTANKSGLNDLQHVALKASQEVFTEVKDTAVATPFLQDRSSIDAYLEKRMQRINASSNLLEAKSTKKGLQIGSLIKVDATKKNDDGTEDTHHYGVYIITEIKHKADIGGAYENTFTAVPSSVEGLPLQENIKEAQINNQIATVVSNEDPEGKGRVQVQFPWQVAAGDKTDFIRVMAADAGSSDLTETNRGLVFIPEEGDQVMVGFEFADPNRPFVLGSMFTGLTGAGGAEKNYKKSIVTRSGHTIELDDTDDAQKITIRDNDGSIIIFDTQEKSLTINANENINIAAKNITIAAEENINIAAKGAIEVAAEGDVSHLSQGELQLQSSGNTNVKSNGAVAIEAANDATVKGMNAIIEGQAAAEVNGAQTKVTGSAVAEVTGGLVKVN